MLLQSKEITIEFEGEKLRFNIGKFPATAGREIISKYPIANMPKLGDYDVSEETMLKLMNYVERVYDDHTQVLTSRTLIDNHVPSWEVLLNLEMQAIGYNCSFFQNGKAINFINKLKDILDTELKELIPYLKKVLNEKQLQTVMSNKN